MLTFSLASSYASKHEFVLVQRILFCYIHKKTPTLSMFLSSPTLDLCYHYKQYIHLFRIVTALPFVVFQWNPPSVASCVTTKLQLLSHVVQLWNKTILMQGCTIYYFGSIDTYHFLYTIIGSTSSSSDRIRMVRATYTHIFHYHHVFVFPLYMKPGKCDTFINWDI